MHKVFIFCRKILITVSCISAILLSTCITGCGWTNKEHFYMIYISEKGGSIEGIDVQSVAYGEDATAVAAIADDGYAFVKWSDGVETSQRQDKHITGNHTVTAIFAILVQYTVANNSGGKIQQNACQKLSLYEDAEPVIAVPDEGYIFTGWSDFIATAERQDCSIRKPLEVKAYFAPISKTFSYQYNQATSGNEAASITINREEVEKAVFAIPERKGYIFGGWYTSRDYTLKVANENGVLMLGYYTLELETDTLYARWIDENDNIVPYKILMVYADETDAVLTTIDKVSVEAKYRVSPTERLIHIKNSQYFSEYLNEWFKGEVRFEVDTYFTIFPLNEDCFESGLTSFGKLDYYAMADNIPELSKLLSSYRSILTTFGLNDWEGYLHFSSGTGRAKYGAIVQDTSLNILLRYEGIAEQQLAAEKEFYRWQEELSGYFHEFIHTIEQQYPYGTILEYHKVYGSIEDTYHIEIDRRYLLGEIIIDGTMQGIPNSYWYELTDWEVS